MKRQLKECLFTVAALVAYGVMFLAVVGTGLFFLFVILAIWGSLFDLLS